jgi:hypothetical protein
VPKKPFFEKQMTFYVDAMETVSKLANSDPTEAGVVDHFWEIYWGRLAAVEDTQVDRAMVIFGKNLTAKSAKGLLPGGFAALGAEREEVMGRYLAGDDGHSS